MKNIALGAIAASVFCAQASVIGITADFRGETPPNRAMRDIKFPCDLSNAAGVEFDMKVEDRTEFSMFSYHLDCDGRAQKPVDEVTEWHEGGEGGASIADLLNKNS